MSYRILFRFSYIADKQFIGHNSSKISEPWGVYIFLLTIFQKIQIPTTTIVILVIIYFLTNINFGDWQQV